MAKPEATVIASAADARRLGRYVLLGEIAEGGMGRIYLARAAGAAGFEKLFALKIMHQGLADRSPELAEMFLDEARINSLVRHPNVCAVADFGEEQGVRYLVMEYMIGQTLLDVLRRVFKTPGIREQSLFWAFAARIVAEACEGLHAAHTAVDEHGQPMHVIHRDISPENVFMTYNGAVKVFDFGIAKASGRRHQTVAGTFKGKFAYASPEAFGRAGVDARSDLWSMGVVLWELLAGRALFHRESEAEILGAIFQEPIPKVATIQPRCPPALQEVVDRALERDREVRYQSAREIARDLNRIAIKSGEHLGTAEIAEWMRDLFRREYQASIETGRSVRRLDTQEIDAAPKLEGRPPKGLISQVVSRPDSLPSSLYSEPTVIHAQYVDEQAETDLAGSPMVDEIFASPSSPGAPLPRDLDFAEGDVSSSASLGAPSPWSESTSESGPAGAPSPFTDPPTIETEKRPVVGTWLKIVIAVVALAAGIYLADMATSSGTATETATPEPTAATQGAEGSGPDAIDTEAPTSPAPGSETSAANDPAEEPPSPAAPEVSPPTQPTTETAAATEPTAPTPAASAPASDTAASSSPRPARPQMRARMAAMEAAGDPGTVSVFAVGGWADIYEGRRRLGRTPARLSLPPGRHVLTLRPAEGRALRRTVDVPAGGSVRVRVEL